METATRLEIKPPDIEPGKQPPDRIGFPNDRGGFCIYNSIFCYFRKTQLIEAMQAVKQIVKPNEKRQVVIDLPADFLADEVEVIILPVLEPVKAISDSEQNLTEEQKLLLAFPVATDEDIEFIEEKRRHFNSWK